MEYNDSAVKLNSILTTRRRRFIPSFLPLGIPPWLRIFSSVQKSYDDLSGRPGYIASGSGRDMRVTIAQYTRKRLFKYLVGIV